MSDFDRAEAETYDRRIRGLVPGYGLLHRLAGELAAAHLGDRGEVLVCGAGTGGELIALAAVGSGWRFTALDPSPVMLAEAERRVSEAGLSHRVCFVRSRLEAWEPPRRFDVGVSHLVSHFLPDDGAKGAYFRALGACLKPGALCLTAEFSADGGGRFRRAYGGWLRAANADPEEILSRIDGGFFGIDESRLTEIFQRSDLGTPQLYFTAYDVRGYCAVRD
ncbi:MAG: class I SAM-dependent methyltransferase [Acidobacteriota bacterium]